MESLGFSRRQRHGVHPHTSYGVEFPGGPVAIGDEIIHNFAELSSRAGVLRLLHPTECVMDRLTWFIHNAEWRMQFVWPFKPAYLIVYLDHDYQKIIIGVPDLNNVWIMSRRPQMSESEYQRMLELRSQPRLRRREGERVPQRWPAE